MMGMKRLAIYQLIGKQMLLHRAKQMLRLPQAQFTVLCLLMYFLFVKVYRPLLLSLTSIGKLVFYWVTVHVIGILTLWHSSLKLASAVHLILMRKLWREVLAPMVYIMWHSQAALRSFGIYLASALQDCVAKWALTLLLALFKQTALPNIPSPGDQLHRSVRPFLQDNTEAYQTELRQGMKQIVVSLFLGFLDGVQDAFHLSAEAVKYILTQCFYSIRPTSCSGCKDNTFDDITHVLSHSCIPLCSRFSGPAGSILKDIPQSFAVLKFVVATESIVNGPGKYGLDVTNIPLHVRFQNKSGMKNASLSIVETDAIVKQMKVACVVFITLYLSMFFSVIKNIR